MKYFYPKFLSLFLSSFLLFSCEYRVNQNHKIAAKQSILDTGKVQILAIEEVPKKVDSAVIIPIDAVINDSIKNPEPILVPIIISNPKALAVVNFAKSLLKTPYVYGGKNLKTGFDSSGFISFVFNHFGIIVPATASGFANIGKTVAINEVSEGDLLLIAKSDLDKKTVAYVGIVLSKKGEPIEFIYANSGKVKAVTISSFNSYYQKRLVKVISILP